MKKDIWWYIILAFILGLIIGYAIAYSMSITGKVITCGNGICEPMESNTCPVDCPTQCGNGICQSGESITCPVDCPIKEVGG